MAPIIVTVPRIYSHSIQFSSVAQSCPTLCDPMNHSTTDLPVHHQLPEFTQTHVYRVGDAIQPSHPLSSPFPPAPNPSQHPSFSNESTFCMRWPKYWSFSLSISPSNEHRGLVSFRRPSSRDLQEYSWAAQFKSINSLAWSLLHSPTLTSTHDHWKNHTLTRWTFVGKVKGWQNISLLFNMLSRLVITLLPRSKHLLISWLQSPSAVILEPQKIKSDTVPPSISHEVMGPDTMIFVFWMLSFKPTFSLSCFTFIKRLFSSSSLSAIRVVSSAYLR